MGAELSDLPAGFVLDQAAGLPPGFALDPSPDPQSAPPPQGGTFLGGFAHGLARPFIGMMRDVINAPGRDYHFMLGDPEIGHGGMVQTSAKDVNAALNKMEGDYQSQRGPNAGFDWGDLAGNIASPANVALGAISTPWKMGSALLSGAVSGAMQPDNVTDPADFWPQKAKQMGLGAAAGGVGYGAAKVGSAILNPVYSRAKQTLLDAGVPLTMGQTLGGVAQTAEDAAKNIPLIGGMIKARQRDSVVGLNRAAINAALEPIGEELPKGLAGNEAVEFASTKLGDAYDNLLPKLSAAPDQQFLGDVQQIVAKAKSDYLLPDAQAKQLSDIIDSQITGKAIGGQYTGEALKNIQSTLGTKARAYAKAADPDQRSLGQVLTDLRSTFNDLIARQNPNDAEALNSINSGWANFVRVRQAAAGATKDGIFTPAQLAQAVRAKAATQGQAASGHALMQDLASAGKEVLPQTIPDSGTTERLLHDLGLIGLAGGGEGLVSPEMLAPTAAGIGAGSALYSRPMQSVIRTMLTKRPDLARKIGAALIANPSIPGAVGSAAALPMLQNGVAQ